MQKLFLPYLRVVSKQFFRASDMNRLSENLWFGVYIVVRQCEKFSQFSNDETFFFKKEGNIQNQTPLSKTESQQRSKKNDLYQNYTL